MRISGLAIATLFALWMVSAADAAEPQADARVESEDTAVASEAVEEGAGDEAPCWRSASGCSTPSA